MFLIVMAFQYGSLSLSDGETSYADIPFPAAFAATPPVIIAIVENTSADVTKLLITATVVDKDNEKFTIELSGAPNSDNYTLVWLAGSNDLFFAAITQGRKITSIPTRSVPLSDDDKIPWVRMSPVPLLEMMTWQTVRQNFPNLAASAPAAPTDPGVANQIFLQDGRIFMHNGTRWVYTGVVDSSTWGGANVFTDFREDIIALTSGEQVQDITFLEAFETGTQLMITCQIYNVEAEDKLVLHGIVTSWDHTGFQLTLNAPPDSANYMVYYQARKLTVTPTS